MARRPAPQGWGVTAPEITGKMGDGSDYFPPESVAEWSVNSGAQAGPNAVSLSKAGAPGVRHFITGLNGSVNKVAPAQGRVTITVEGVEFYHSFFFETLNVEFSTPLACPVGAGISVVLFNADAAVTGTVGFRGYSVNT